MQRKAHVSRKTAETKIELELTLDGEGKYALKTGLPFFEHMLSQVAYHGSFDLEISASGDLGTGYHHLVEDLGLCLGQALREALGEKKGIKRYAHSLLPMDEALILVALDLSGRPYLNYDFQLPPGNIGGLDGELVEEFLRSFANEGKLTMHVKQLDGQNKHHLVEALFKALGRALKEAVEITGSDGVVPSTKGVLS